MDLFKQTKWELEESKEYSGLEKETQKSNAIVYSGAFWADGEGVKPFIHLPWDWNPGIAQLRA